MDAVLADGINRVAGRRSRHPDFKRLLGEAAWHRLPATVRDRFGEQVAEHVVYRGVAKVEASRGGRWFAQACRLIGTPVAPFTGDAVPMTVHVDATEGGVVWERHYEFPGRAPVIVRSTKQLDDNGVLIEALNAGLCMTLRVFEDRGELHFLSTGYFFRLGPLRFRLPDWFLPGETHVVHQDLGSDTFRFSMATNHRWFGRMYFQDGVFH